MASHHVLDAVVWPSTPSGSESDDAAAGDGEDDAAVGDGEGDALQPLAQGDAAVGDGEGDAAVGMCDAAVCDGEADVAALGGGEGDRAAAGEGSDDWSMAGSCVAELGEVEVVGGRDWGMPGSCMAGVEEVEFASTGAGEGSEDWGRPGSCMPEVGVEAQPQKTKTRLYDHVYRAVSKPSSFSSSSSSAQRLNLVRYDYKAVQTCAVSTLCQPPATYDMRWVLQVDGENLYEHCKEAILRVLRARLRRFYIGITCDVIKRWREHRASKERSFISMDVLLQSYGAERNRAVEIWLCHAFHDGVIALEDSSRPLSEFIINVRNTPSGGLFTNADGDSYLYVCWC